MESEPAYSAYLSISIFFLALQPMGTTIGFILLLILIIFSAMISGSEVAYFSLKPRDRALLNSSQRKSNLRIKRLRNRPKSLLATILISNNFINIGIVILSDYLLKNMLSDTVYIKWAQYVSMNLEITWLSETMMVNVFSFLVTVVIVSFALVLFGEVTPKIYASLHNLKFAQTMSLPLSTLMRVLWPFSKMMVNWTDGMENLFRKNKSRTNPKDLSKAIELAVTQDIGSQDEEVDILKGIIKFGDVTVKQIMKSRVDVIAFDVQTDFHSLLDVIVEEGYSRIPVFKEDFDNIEGVLYVKDLLGHTNNDKDFQWQKLIRKNVLYVPETKKINELLKEFQVKRLHLAIVVDEYGGSSGIVTLEDIMEEVIGDIKDEFDDEKEVEYLKIDEHNYLFEGKTLLNDVCRIIGVDTDIFNDIKGEADSLAGLILELVGYIPKIDKEISYGRFKFKVVASSKRRIKKINISIKSE